MLAHRAMYAREIGAVPAGLTLDHRCRVRCCVNPAHLRPLTNRENVLAGEGITAINARRSFCSRGHSLADARVVRRSNRGAHRLCRVCDRAREAARRGHS